MRPHAAVAVIIRNNERILLGKRRDKEPENFYEWRWFTWDELPKHLWITVKELKKQGFDPWHFTES